MSLVENSNSPFFGVKSLCELLGIVCSKGVVNIVAPDVVKIYVPEDSVSIVETYLKEYTPITCLVTVSKILQEVDFSGIVVVRAY